MSLLTSVKRALDRTDAPQSVNELPQSALTPILNKNGAGIEDAIQTVADLMHHSETERIRLDSAAKVLNLHGVHETRNEIDNRIMIVVQDHGNHNDNSEEMLQNMLNPRRLQNVVDIEAE